MIHPERLLLILTAAWTVAGSTPLWGSTSVLAGMFDGAEATAPPVPGSYCTGDRVPYRDSPFMVSARGVYVAYSGLPSGANAPELSISIYRGAFEPESPLTNLVWSWREDGSVRAAPKVQLEPGEAYQLVVRQECGVREGAWAVALVGPGTAQSVDAVVVPSYTSGRFSESDPELPLLTGCSSEAQGPVRFKVIGPIRVSHSGAHYFQSPTFTDPVEVLCFSVYSAHPSADSPDTHLVQRMFLAGQLELEAGRDYWLAISPYHQSSTHEYSFVLAPPAPFRINKGLADAWYNPEMPGQGIFLDVFDDSNSLFLGWFTYALEGEPSDEARHRWLTAFGPFEGAGSRLDLQWSAADHPRPEGQPPNLQVDGWLDLEFHDCRSGLIRYAWGANASGTALVEGEMPVRRIAHDNVALCESLYAGPGMPGQL
jgi:hypothetical protein